MNPSTRRTETQSPHSNPSGWNDVPVHSLVVYDDALCAIRAREVVVVVAIEEGDPPAERAHRGDGVLAVRKQVQHDLSRRRLLQQLEEHALPHDGCDGGLALPLYGVARNVVLC